MEGLNSPRLKVESGRRRTVWWQRARAATAIATGVTLMLVGVTSAFGQPLDEAPSGEANLKLPDLSQVQFLGIDGHKLLMIGIVFCVLGLLFGLVIYSHLKNLPVHRSMADVSQLIWETCKTYLVTQGKFLALLWVFIAAVILLYSPSCCTMRLCEWPSSCCSA